ncbi:Asp-tRNA(Asn)/Glu-tRNA(Gln) amidotransferase subunit GatB [Sideroxyarcus sp. TK5]
MSWEIVIGLEVHVQLSTQSKIFCGASTAFGAEPNTQADAVSLALPGVLPVLNKGAVERAIKFGLATGAHIAPRSVFARKNYFYPDLPKGYQISQFELPVVGQGALTIQVPAQGKQPAYEKVVRLTRAHLEEDAGKSLHEDFHGMTGIDLNRAGTPLLEIVSEPDMRSAAEAVAYAKTLHTLVQWIGICDGNMQEGSFRCDANVSVHKPGTPFGTRREIKNLNSFRFLEQAINYEVQHQIAVLEDGGSIQQATVLFDPDTGETRVMRTKEDAHDYRYFPDPDLLPLEISEEWKQQVAATLPELPHTKQERYVRDLGLSAYDANVLTQSKGIAEYFEATAQACNQPKLAANWVINDVRRFMTEGAKDENGEPAASEVRDGVPGRDAIRVPAESLGKLISRITDSTISNAGAKKLFSALWTAQDTTNVDLLIEQMGLKQVSDSGAIEKIVDEIMAANTDKVAEYRSGKDKLFGFFVGQAMKASKGQANPAQLNEILKAKLAG